MALEKLKTFEDGERFGSIRKKINDNFAQLEAATETINLQQQIADAIDIHNTDKNNDQHSTIRNLITNLEFIVNGTYNPDTGDVVLVRRDNSTIMFNTYEAATAQCKALNDSLDTKIAQSLETVLIDGGNF